MTTFERFLAKVKINRNTECWEWHAALTKTGYAKFGLPGPQGQKTVRGHRYSWEVRYGKIPDDLLVCHRCDNRICVNPSHLFLGTQVDNMHDSTSKGRSVNGDGYGVMDENKVRTILAGTFKGETQDQIASRFGVSRQLIQKILARKKWKYVTT